jgi:biopolymer transport protein ExbD
MKNTRRAHARRFIILAALAALAGCATTRTIPPADRTAPADLALYTDASDRVWFNGKPYPVERLAAALRATGVPSNQPIRINIPDSRKRDLFVRVSAALRTAGFSRFFFVSEQHAESRVKTPATPRKP